MMCPSPGVAHPMCGGLLRPHAGALAFLFLALRTHIHTHIAIYISSRSPSDTSCTSPPTASISRFVRVPPLTAALCAGIAMFLLVLSSVLLVLYLFFMVVFFLKRDVFEIRARYVYYVCMYVCVMESQDKPDGGPVSTTEWMLQRRLRVCDLCPTGYHRK